MKLNMEKYFTEEIYYRDVFFIAKLQFREIMKDHNEAEFKILFDELFYNTEGYRLFLKDGDSVVCGGLGHFYKDTIFVDIYFWNSIFKKYDKNLFRCWLNEIVTRTSKKGITSLVAPLSVKRHKFEFFKKFNQMTFRCKKVFDPKDEYIKKLYPHHYLLEVDFEEYRSHFLI